jgi:TPR repeat protein
MKRLLLAIGISALLVACGDSEMVSKANSGDPQAQFDLAMAYREGKDIQKDLQASFKWLKEAAKTGHVEAQYELARDYAVEAEGNRETSRLGVGTAIKYFARDYGFAVQWFHEAAQKGHVGAQLELAKLYFAGWGIQQSDDKAKEWAEKAKAKGNKDADKVLADIAAGNRPDTGFGKVRGNPHGGTSGAGKGN